MVSMKDIAEAAGVSQSTVSFVLSGRYKKDLRISDEVVKRVKETARKMKYRRNALAGAMKSGKTNIVGLIGNLVHPGHGYVLNMINAVSATLQQHGYLLKIFSIEENNFTELSKQCIEQMLCGIIARSLSKEQLNFLRKEVAPYNIPVILLGNSFHYDWCSRIISDDIAGCRIAISHLFELGHRRIGHLTRESDSGVIALREQGYREGMTAAGLNVGKENFLHLGLAFEMQEEDYISFDKYYDRFKPTALLCSSDALAMKLLLWAYTRNIKVPEQISVVGFGDAESAALTCPPLTTIAHPYEKMGCRSAEKLIELIEGKTRHQSDEVMAVSLIVRKSTTYFKSL